MRRMIRLIPILLIFGIIIVDFALAGQSRKRISAIEKESSNISDLEAEIRFGRELAARILGNYSLVADEKINRYVNLVGKSLALYGGRPELRYYFGVLNSDEINAFAASGGYIFITKGALKQMDSEAELAAVLAHEIAHVVKKHIVKALNIKGDEGSAVGGIASLIGGTTASFRVALDKALNDAADILLNKGYKIEDEIEADSVGVLLASVAGFNPSALKDFLNRAKSFEKEDITYKGEHPIHEVRIRKIEETLKENGLQNVKKANVRERFYENIKK